MQRAGDGDDEARAPKPGAVMRVSSTERYSRRVIEIVGAYHGSFCFVMLLMPFVAWAFPIYLRVACIHAGSVLLPDVTELVRQGLSLCYITLVNIFLLYVVTL